MYLKEYPLLNRLFWLLQHSCYAILFAQSFFLLSGYDCNSLICFLALQACYAPRAYFIFILTSWIYPILRFTQWTSVSPTMFLLCLEIFLLADLCIYCQISTPWLCVCTITQLSRCVSAFIFLSAPADSLGGLQPQRVIFYLMTSLMSCNDLHGISLTLHHVMI